MRKGYHKELLGFYDSPTLRKEAISEITRAQLVINDYFNALPEKGCYLEKIKLLIAYQKLTRIKYWMQELKDSCTGWY